jgi:hypothetical protein
MRTPVIKLNGTLSTTTADILWLSVPKKMVARTSSGTRQQNAGTVNRLDAFQRCPASRAALSNVAPGLCGRTAMVARKIGTSPHGKPYWGRANCAFRRSCGDIQPEARSSKPAYHERAGRERSVLLFAFAILTVAECERPRKRRWLLPEQPVKEYLVGNSL